MISKEEWRKGVKARWDRVYDHLDERDGYKHERNYEHITLETLMVNGEVVHRRKHAYSEGDSSPSI